MRKTNNLPALIFITASALSASSAVVANPGFYVGAQIGYQNTSIKEVYSEEIGPGVFGVDTTDGLSADGFAGGVFAGTKFNMNNGFFFGAEVNAGTGSAEHELKYSEAGLSASMKLESKTSYGIAALAGVSLASDTSLYGRLGYQRTKFEQKLSVLGLSGSESENFGGVRIGIGMETSLAEQLALRLDWSQTYYSSKTFDVDVGETVKFEPTESLFQIGVSYNF